MNIRQCERLPSRFDMQMVTKATKVTNQKCDLIIQMKKCEKSFDMAGSLT